MDEVTSLWVDDLSRERKDKLVDGRTKQKTDELTEGLSD